MKLAIKLVEAEATNINNNAINVKRVLSSFPTISVGFVNNLSIEIKFFSKMTLDPNTKEIAKNEKNNKFRSKLKLPLFTSLSLFTYLEKSPKFTIIIEKYAKKVPATESKAIKFSLL